MRNDSRCTINGIGRIVIPVRIRNQLGLIPGTPVEIFVQNGLIQLRKHSEACVFCGASDKLRLYKTQRVCTSCMDQASGAARSQIG